MHEVALAEGVLRIVTDAARASAAARVHTVWVELGALAHVEPDALAFCFDAVTRDIARTPGSAWCMPCSVEVPIGRLGDACPRCGSHQLQVLQGDEMRVKEIGIA